MSRLISFAAMALAAALVLPDGARLRASTAPTTRTIYFSALDEKGAVVADLTAADIAVKEGGKDYPVVSLQPAKAPMHIALLVDDGGGGGFQAGVAQFLQKVSTRGKIAISVFTPKATRIVDFTSDFEPLKAGLTQIGARARIKVDGDQLIEAIQESARTLTQLKAVRPIIVAMTIAGGEPEVIDAVNVLNTLRQSGASLHLVAAPGAELSQVLNDGPKHSGGRAELAGSPALMTTGLATLADTLIGQYELTYTLPDGVKMADRLAVTTSRKGVRLIAPQRIPDK